MNLLMPSALWFLLSIAAIIVLYVVRRRAKPVPVTTLPFFKLLHKHLAESPWMRRLKRLLSFLLSVLIVLGVIFALAKPISEIGEEQPQAVVIVVDRSASMAARSDSSTILELGLQKIKNALSAIPAQVPVAIIASDIQPEVMSPMSTDRLAVVYALEQIKAQSIPGNHHHALTLAKHLSQEYKRTEIWLLSDEIHEDKSNIVPFTIKRSAGHNAGITACALRRKPQERNQLEAFVELQATDNVSVKLEIIEDGNLTTLRAIDLIAGERHRLLLPVSAGVGEHIAFQIHSEGDVLASDDQVLLKVPQKNTLEVAWVSKNADGFTGLALATLAQDFSIKQLTPDQWSPKVKADILIADQWYPKEVPAHLSGVLVLNPPETISGLRIDHIKPQIVSPPRVQQQAHALLFGVNSPRLSLAQTAIISGDDWLQPVWAGDSGALMSAGIRHNQRIVVMGFDPTRSPELAMTTSYPSLLANALYWCAPNHAEEFPVYSCGELISHESDSAHWIMADDKEVTIEQRQHLLLDRIGIWQVGEQSGSSALLSAQETLLPNLAVTDIDKKTADIASHFIDWSHLLVLIVLAIMVIEAWACHRKGVF